MQLDISFPLFFFSNKIDVKIFHDKKKPTVVNKLSSALSGPHFSGSCEIILKKSQNFHSLPFAG